MRVTKTDLRAYEQSLKLAKLGYELMDRKRIILMQELSRMIDEVKALRKEIDISFEEAYQSLQRANINQGSYKTKQMAEQVMIDDGLKIVYRSVMGVDIPRVSHEEETALEPIRLLDTTTAMHEAYVMMQNLKRNTMKLAEIDNGMYRLAKAIDKSKKRANALENVVIPDLQSKIKFIQDALEEKEREEFIRLKLVKRAKEKNS